MDRGGAVPNDRCDAARRSSHSGARRLRRAERAHLRHTRRQAWGLVLLARRDAAVGGADCSGSFPPAVPRRSHRDRLQPGDGEYESVRTDRAAADAELSVGYGPVGPPASSTTGSLEEFLTERYCLYAADRRGRLYRGEIDHPQWPLQPAFARVDRCTMTRPLGIELGPEPPIAHFAASLDVVAWLPKRIPNCDLPPSRLST